MLNFQIPSFDETDDIEGNHTKHGCRNTPERNDQQNGQNQDIRKRPWPRVGWHIIDFS